MRALRLVVVCAAVAAVASSPAGQATTAETVACSSTATTRVNLTGTWRGSDGSTYRIRQVGTCIWWAGSTNAFFGTLSSSGSSVYGLWASISGGGNGSLLLTVRSSSSLTRRGSTGGFPASSWKRSAS